MALARFPIANTPTDGERKVAFQGDSGPEQRNRREVVDGSMPKSWRDVLVGKVKRPGSSIFSADEEEMASHLWRVYDGRDLILDKFMFPDIAFRPRQEEEDDV